MTPRSEFLAGCRSQLPIIMGTMPFGMIFGVLAVSAGLSQSLAQAMSFVVFAGSAQFVGQGMLGAGDPALLIVLTTFIINLRHVLYSASVEPYIKHLPARWKYLLAYLLTDEAYATTIVRYRQGGGAPGELRHAHWFFLGAGFTLWFSWQLSTAVGVFLGAQIPGSWSLDFTMAVTFIGIVVVSLRDRASLAAALSAGIVAVAAAGLPYKLGIMLAALIGIGVGMMVENNAPVAQPQPIKSTNRLE